MIGSKGWRWALALLASGAIVSPVCSAAEVAAKPPVVLDVALTEGGTLVGRVLDAQGIPLAKTKVEVINPQDQAMSVQTDEAGRFTVSGLSQGGMFRVSAAGNQRIYRVWMPGTAPPGAVSQVVIVAGQPIDRGQFTKPAMWLASPWVAVGIVGAAIVVPVALSTSFDNPPASP